MSNKKINFSTNLISKFIENDYKLSSVHKILRDVDEHEDKMRFIERYDLSKDKILDVNHEILSFILSKEKKINLFEIEKINLFIFIIDGINIGKINEMKCIEFCQKQIMTWPNCNYFVIYINKKASLIQKIIFNGINTFIHIE